MWLLRIHNSTLNNSVEKKIGDADKKVPDASGLVTTTVLNSKISKVKNKIPNTSNLVITTVLNTKINKVGNKIPNNSKYINIQDINKLMAENFAARLKQADFVNKTDFNNKLTSFIRLITSNKTKHLEVQKKLHSLITRPVNNFAITKLIYKDKNNNKFVVFFILIYRSNNKRLYFFVR